MSLACLLVVSGACPARVEAQSEFSVAGFTEDVVLKLNFPGAAVAFTPNSTAGNERIYIADKRGRIWVAVNGALQPQPFLDISQTVNTNTDRGLIAIAVDPDFPSKPYVYFGYTLNANSQDLPTTDGGPRAVQVARVLADASQDYNVASGPLEVIIGQNSTVANIAPAPEAQPLGDPVDPSYGPANRASCMTGLTMLKDESGKGEPIQDCVAADGKSHTAGTLIFGSDKSLYASFGDGTDYDNPWPAGLRAQNVDSLNGKVLRVNRDTGNGLSDNPFYDPSHPTANRSKVWALGLRNPFRVTVDPANGQAYVCDVGTSYWEEINSGKGSNLGWPCYEGAVPATGPQCQDGQVIRPPAFGGNTYSRKHPRYQNGPYTAQLCAAVYAANATTPPPQPPVFVSPPLFAYEHRYDCSTTPPRDAGASATGAAFYSTGATAYPDEFKGSLFIADYAERRVRYLTFDGNAVPTSHDFGQEIAGSRAGPVQLLTGPDTNIYMLTLDLSTKSSQVRRIRYAGSAAPPSVAVQANPTAGSVPLIVNFSSNGTVDPNGRPLTYSWDFGDGGTSTDPNPSHTYSAVGSFTATLTATESVAPFTAGTASVTVRTGVAPPKVFIDSPADKATYGVGQTIQFSGHADFNQPGNVNLAWTVILKHNEHEHLVQEASGPSGSFVVEDHGDNSRYILCLFADAGAGLQDQKCIDLLPKRVNYTLASNPVGATLTLSSGEDLQSLLAPVKVPLILGSAHTITAPLIFSGRSFSAWSDGVTTSQRGFVVGNTAVTLTAKYVNKAPVAKIIANPTKGTSPLNVTFDGTASSDPEGDPLSFLWDFGDGTTSDEPIVAKTFSDPGVFGVTLTVVDKGGSSTKVATTIRVNAPTPTPPSDMTPTPTSTPTSTPTPSATPTPGVTPSATPSTIATGVPTPRFTPTGAPTANPVVENATPTPTMPVLTRPRVTLSRGNHLCGGPRGPCLVEGRSPVVIHATISSADVASVAAISIVANRLLRKPSAQQIIITKEMRLTRSRITLRLPRRQLSRGSRYRIAVKITSKFGNIALSRYRYIRTT